MSEQRSAIVTLLIMALILLLAVAGYYLWSTYRGSHDAADSDAAMVFKNASSTVFTDLSGKQTDITTFEGKVRVVNAWASWSPYARTELPLLAEISKQYSPEEVVFLAVNRGEPAPIANQYIATLGDMGALQTVIDQEDQYYDTAGGYAMPETIVFDRTGNKVLHKRGLLEKQELIDLLATLLTE